LKGLTRLQDFAERLSKTAPRNPVHPENPDNHVPDLSAGTGVRLPDSEEDYYRVTKALPVPTSPRLSSSTDPVNQLEIMRPMQVQR
jgi:hypothetical protein